MARFTSRGILMGRLDHGGDLLGQITAICRAENIQMGRVEAIGAVSSARLGFYDQRKRQYEYFVSNQSLEILSLIGNISMKDEAVMVHAHVILSDENGDAFGGHLAEGTTVFACEYQIEIFDGPILRRAPDEQTGLPLWEGRKEAGSRSEQGG